MKGLKCLLAFLLFAHLAVLALSDNTPEKEEDQPDSGRKLVVRKKKRPAGSGPPVTTAEDARTQLAEQAGDQDARDGRSLLGSPPFQHFGQRIDTGYGNTRHLSTFSGDLHQQHQFDDVYNPLPLDNPYRARGASIQQQIERQAALAQRVQNAVVQHQPGAKHHAVHVAQPEVVHHVVQPEVVIPDVPGLQEHQLALKLHEEQIQAHLHGAGVHKAHDVRPPLTHIVPFPKESVPLQPVHVQHVEHVHVQPPPPPPPPPPPVQPVHILPPPPSVETVHHSVPEVSVVETHVHQHLAEAVAVKPVHVHAIAEAPVVETQVHHHVEPPQVHVHAVHPAPPPPPVVLPPPPPPPPRVLPPPPPPPPPAVVEEHHVVHLEPPPPPVVHLEPIDVRQGLPEPHLVDIGHVAIAGERCVDKIVAVEETQTDEHIECHHSYNQKCHTTYTTDFDPQQEEECEENFKKNCFIEYKKVAQNETVEFCHTPLIKDCNLAGPVECKTEYESECMTRFHKHVVQEDVPDCKTIKERKCETKTVGYTTEEDCTDWPVERCNVRKEVTEKATPETSCKKVPREKCAPAGCGFVPGPPECFDKMETIIQEVPEETCNLEPQKQCKHVTTLVPNLKPSEECVDVPKETCVRSNENPRKVMKPVTKKWCYTPTKESGLLRR